MNSLDLLVFGDTALDNFFEVESLPKLNHAADVTKSRRFYGGMGANTCVVASNLGLNCGLASVIGTDAEDYRRYMESQGIKLYLKTVFGDTTKSLFFKNNGDQISFFYKGVTEKIDEFNPFKEFGGKIPSNVDSIYMSRTYMGMHNQVVKKFKDSFKVWNPGYGVFKFREIDKTFKKVLKNVDVLIINEHELQHLRDLGFKIDFKSGPKFYIQTKGAEGCIVYSKNTEVQLKTFKTKTVDASGAGDAFNAGFLAAHKKGYDIHEAARVGNVTASFIVEEWGCQTNLPSWSQVMERYNKVK